MSGTSMRVYTVPFNESFNAVVDDTQVTVNKVLMKLARAARDLARATEPHNMKTKDIRARMTPLGPAIKAQGGPAAYDGGRVKSTFRHPIFPRDLPRNKWHWVPQKTDPFIEKAVDDISTVSEREIALALQMLFDRIV